MRNEVGKFPNDFCIENDFAGMRIKDRERHAPATLTGDYPIRTRFDRARDAIFSPRWNPLDRVDCGEGFIAQRVNANEKLVNSAKEDRRLRPPAIRVRMMEVLLAEEHSALAQQIDDIDVGIEDVFADEFRQTSAISKPPMVIDRR